MSELTFFLFHGVQFVSCRNAFIKNSDDTTLLGKS